MDNFYLLLLLVSLVALVLGLYKPSVVRLSSRKLVFLVFGGTAAIFFMLFGLNISSSSPAVSVVAAPVVTATSTPPSPVALYATAMQTSVLPFL